jgi:hypothetical protein
MTFQRRKRKHQPFCGAQFVDLSQDSRVKVPTMVTIITLKPPNFALEGN